MSQFAIVLLSFAAFMTAFFAWYGYRQAQVFWKWPTARWAKTIGTCALGAYLFSLSHSAWRSWRSEVAAERQEQRVREEAHDLKMKPLIDACERRLNLHRARLQKAANDAETKECAAENRTPIWSCPATSNCVWQDSKFGCSKNAAVPMEDIAMHVAPFCNRRRIEVFFCGTPSDLDRLLGSCGLLEETR